MTLRRLRWALLAYAFFDFLFGGINGGFFRLTPLAAAQFTTVSGTVIDPNGLPYAFGTITPLLSVSGTPTLSGFAYTPPTSASGLDGSGKFVMQLADTTQLLPGGSGWNFKVCSGSGSVQPAFGKGPVCFTLAAPIAISGASQDISAQLQAAALALTVTFGGGGGTPCVITGGSLQYNNAGGFGCATPFTFFGSTITSSASGVLDLHSAATTGFFFPGAFATGFARVTTTTGAMTSGEVSGDCTTSAGFSITCLKTNNVAFTALAITTPAAGVATFLATPSSANLFSAMTTKTGSGGSLVFATGPTISTPSISALTLSDVATGTQCLHASGAGLVTGTGSDCGSGGGGISGASNAQPMVATSATTATSYPESCIANRNASGDICADINACYTGAIGPGVSTNSAGVIDARGYPARSNQVCNSNPFTGANRGGVLLLGNYDIYVSKTIITPQKKMRIVGIGQASPLSSGNVISEENTIIRPCTGVNTPVAGCSGSIQQASNQLFIEPTYSATASNAAGTTAVFTTSVNHNYTFTSGSVDSHIKVTGCSVANYNSGSGGNPALYFKVIAATANTVSVTLGTSGNGAAASCTITEPARQHGRYSLTGSGLTNAGNYYAMIAIGGQTGASTGGYDGLGTCGTGPVGANWTFSSFGSTLEQLALSNDGLAGLVGADSGSIQERGGFKDVSFNNYGGITAGNTEENGFMFDRNSYNLNDACSNPAGNFGPSHFTIQNIYCDASPVSNPGGPGASDQSGVCAHLAGNHSESDASSVEDGVPVGGLAQYGITGGGTIRGLNDSGKGKSNYGIWAENYDDGVLCGYHFENLLHDPFYLHGTSGWTSKGWQTCNLDFASSSGTNNAIVHLDTGTDAITVINVRGAVGANPAAVRDEVNGCGAAFGAAAPCIINGLTDGSPMPLFVQGMTNVYNGLIMGKQTAGSNPTITSGTGAPSGACVNGSIWLRTDNGSSPSIYWCRNSVWTATIAVADLPSSVLFNNPTDNTLSVDDTSHRYINLWLSGVLGWTNGAGSADAGVSRDAAGVVDVGNGSAGDASGTVKATVLQLIGSNGGWSATEGTGASVSTGAGKDAIFPDSTSHGMHANYNNTDVGILVAGGTAAVTSGNIPKYNGTTGAVIQDAGFLASSIVRTDTTNAAGTGMTLDLSASTVVNAFKLPAGVGANPSLQFSGMAANTGFYSPSATVATWNSSGNNVADFTGTGIEVANTRAFTISSTNAGNGAVTLGMSAVGSGAATQAIAFGNGTVGDDTGLTRAGGTCRLSADATLSTSATNLCSWTLPNVTKVWALQCNFGWAVTAGTTPTLSFGVNASQTPAGTTNVFGEIKTTNTNTATQASAALSASGALNVITSPALTTSATLFQAYLFGTLNANATSGTFVVTATGVGASFAGAVKAGSMCVLN